MLSGSHICTAIPVSSQLAPTYLVPASVDYTKGSTADHGAHALVPDVASAVHELFGALIL